MRRANVLLAVLLLLSAAPARNGAQSDAVKELAAKLAAAATDDEREVLLTDGKDLVGAGLVRALNEQGRGLAGRKEYGRALSVHGLALKVAERSGDKSGLAESLLGLGQTHSLQGVYPRALEFFGRALEAFEAAGEKKRFSATLRSLANVYRLQSNFPQALEYHQRDLKLNEELGDRQGIANATINVGFLYQQQGENARALEYLEKGLKLNEELQHKPGVATALANLAATHRAMGHTAQSLEYARRSLALYEESGDKAGIARIHAEVGSIEYMLGNTRQALEHYEKSLKLQEELGDKFGVGLRLMNIGNVYSALGNNVLAVEYLRKSLKLCEEVGNRLGAANAISTLGSAHLQQGDYEQALEHFQRALKLFQELRLVARAGDTYNNIGNVYRLQGSYEHALDYFRKGLDQNDISKNKSGLAMSLHRSGLVYLALGDYEQALEFVQKALKLREEVGEKVRVADSVNVIGIIHYERGNYERALTYFEKSLTLMKEAGNTRGIVIARGGIGSIYLKMGRYEQALGHFLENLVQVELMGDREMHASTLTSLAETHQLRGDHGQSLKFAGQAADIARPAGLRDILRDALTNEGRAQRSLGQLDEARRAFEDAIGVVESVRLDIAGQEARSSYFAKVRELYELYIDLLMELARRQPAKGFAGDALRASERARARSLLDTLSESRADIRRGVEPVLLDDERTKQRRLNSAAEHRTRLLSGKYTEEQAAAAEREVNELTAKLQEVRAEIRLKSPRYAALTQPAALGLKEIQALLDRDTLLLEYALGEERSYLWAVTPTSVASFELPRRDEIEKSVRNVYELLSDGRRWEIGGDAAAARYAEEAGRLSRMLLGPVASQLKGKRLVVVGDGVLQYLPFGALPLPSDGAARPLITENELVSLPSASTVAVLRQEGARRAHPSKRLAVIADPVFEPDDERLAVAATRDAAGARPAPAAGGVEARAKFVRRQLERTLTPRERAAGDGRTIRRLAFTRREAEAILALAPEGQRWKAVDFDASRETATSPRLAEYRLVHFATHGVLDSEHPELSGIVLSLVDRSGNPVDGFLRLHEIYNLDLPADLVVLSACQTALGKEIRGEGLVGLTRGFMYAGSPRVVASLWRVNDAATAELMGRFYHGMLPGKMRPAAALRAAQVEMLKQPRWRAPYYWAAFQLQGEWR